MIIADEDDDQKLKDPPLTLPTVRYPELAASRRSLPDYETSQALAFSGLNDSQSTLHKPPPPRRLLASRVWRAAIASLVVYILLTIIIGVPIIIHKELEDQPKYPYNPLSYLSWPDRKPVPYPPGGITNITSPIQPGIYPICNNWTMVGYHDDPNATSVLASTTFSVQSSGQFSIISNTSPSDNFNVVQGAFYTGINPNQTVQDAVLSIMMQSSSQSVFNQTSTCVALADNFTGLSLMVPDNLTLTDNIKYNITLLFPQTTTPSYIDSFSTSLPMFDQQFSSFGDNLTFGEVSITGEVSRVTVNSIQGEKILVDTSLEPVVGTFRANASLFISTIMAPIFANISLYNDPNCQFPTTLDVYTGNSNLTANVTMLAPNEQPPSRPNFVASLRTFSGLLSTDFSHDPDSPPTNLQLHVVNDLGPVDVTLDSLFQGAFQVSTKQATVNVSQGTGDVLNPWQSGAERSMQMNVNYTARSYGWIGWGTEQLPWTRSGEAIIETSLANATLLFLG